MVLLVGAATLLAALLLLWLPGSLGILLVAAFIAAPYDVRPLAPRVSLKGEG